jgi:uncharacterized protein (DUF1778 family)
MADGSEARSERVDLRMTPTAKRTLQRGAAAANKTVSEFLLDSGLNAAFDELADRRVFHLDDAQWTAFMRVLSEPPEENRGLADLIGRKPGWA